MMPTNQRNKEDSSATSIKSSLPGPVDRYQAGSACGYWKRKNLRKFRKLRKKKKATPQQDKERKKLEDFKVIQAKWQFLTEETYVVISRCLMVSTNLADPSCFYFRIS